MKSASVLLLILCLGSPMLICQELSNTTDTPTIPDLPDVNQRLLRIVIEDQWDRGNDLFTGKLAKQSGKVNVAERDAGRQAEVRKILSEGKISKGQEYYFAALIFQHSSSPENLMLAHVLAVTAVNKQNIHAKWMAAATLDRYLWSVKQPQVFGTQFQRAADQKWTMEPYDRNAVSDGVRSNWCVITLADQEKVLRDMQSDGESASTYAQDCR